MRVIRFVGPSMVAVLFASFGVLTSSASAELRPPIWYECAKTPKEEVKWVEGAREKHKSVYTGSYTTNLCEGPPLSAGPIRAKGSNPGPEGKYELQPGTGAGKRLTGKSGKSELRVVSPFPEQKVTCEKGKVEGGLAEVPNLVGDFTVVFQKCHALEGEEEIECHSPNAIKHEKLVPGEIKTKELKGELGWVNEASPAVGLRVEGTEEETVEGEPVKPLVRFECGKKGNARHPFAPQVTASVYGQLIGAQSEDLNVINRDLKLDYVVGKNYGTHEYEEKSFEPLVNIIGWASEAEGILQHQEEGKEAEDPAHVLKGVYCGSLVKLVTGKGCTPLTFSGLAWEITIKGNPLMVKEEA